MREVETSYCGIRLSYALRSVRAEGKEPTARTSSLELSAGSDDLSDCRSWPAWLWLTQ